MTRPTDWSHTTPEAAGFDPAALDGAIAFHRAHETRWPASMYMPDGRYVGTAAIGDRPEHAAVLGPVFPRGAPNGLVLRHGRIVAEWGDTARPDMTFSVSKSYLAILAGLAHADGLVPDLDRPVAHDVAAPQARAWFAAPANAAITWRHLLQQTSEWSGTLWGKPDSADHNRVVGGSGGGTDGATGATGAAAAAKGEARALARPGEHFEYNDVRVNLLAACLTERFGRPLPDVLRQRVMDPIGASADWAWHGYAGADVEVSGEPVRAVSGGGHWGGGMVIGSRDHARMGLLVARDGMWGERRVLPEGWVAAMTQPSPRNPQYGLLWWLNGGAAPRYPEVPRNAVLALGAGTSVVCVLPALDVVVVARWIDGPQVGTFLGRVVAALR